MSPADLALTAIFSAAAAVMATISALAALAPLLIPRLPTDADSNPHAGADPDTAIVLAARDEQARIERTVRDALAQHPRQPVIVANDRSADRTPRILDDLAANHPRLTIVHIDHLPQGWLGKTHALSVALRHAPPADECPWVLFIDADTHLAPNTLNAARKHAARKHADHLIALPGYPADSTAGAAATAATYLIFIARCVANQLRIPRSGVGIGAFTLVRRDALHAVGGLENLRLEIVEDVKLGILLQRASFRTAVADAIHAVQIDWRANARSLIALLEKNFFAIARFSTPRATAYIAANLACFLAGLSGWATAAFATGLHPAPRVAAAAATAALLSKAIPAAHIVRRYQWPAAAALLAPFAMTTPAIALFHSTRRTLRNRGVTWRDTHYPIAELKRHQVL